MPRTTQQIIEHAEELAAAFENMEPTGEPEVTPLGELYLAVQEHARAERELKSKVESAREAGLSWPVIGQMLGTSDEAARKRFGHSGTVTPTRRGGPAPKRGVARYAAAKTVKEAAMAPLRVAASTTKGIAAKATKGATSKSTRGAINKANRGGATSKSAKGATSKSTRGALGKSTKRAAAKSSGTRSRRSK